MPTMRAWSDTAPVVVAMVLLVAGGCGSPAAPSFQPPGTTPPPPPAPQGPLIGVRRVEGVIHNSLGAVVPGARIETNGGLVEFTDSRGAFAFPAVVIPDGLLHLKIAKEGHHTMYDKLILGSQAPQPLVVNDIVLLLASLVLPVDGVLPLTLSPNDPPHYVGTIYYSDICHYCTDVEFTAPAGADLVVTLDTGTVTETVQMWALGGEIVGEPQAGNRRALTLPRGTSGSLKVGTTAIGLTQEAAVTISTVSRR